MIIKIKDKNNNNIAKCDLHYQDIGVWDICDKTNIEDISFDINENKDFESEYDNIVNITLSAEIVKKTRKDDFKIEYKEYWENFEDNNL